MPEPKAADLVLRPAPFCGPGDVSLRRRFENRYIKFRAFSVSSHALNDSSNLRRAAMIALSRRMWKEIAGTLYGIAMPKTWYVMGPEPPEQLMRPYIPHRPWERKPGYYMIVEEVIGWPLEEVLAGGDLVLVHELDEILAIMGRYFFDKLMAGRYFITDIGLDQLMVGHTAKISANHVLWVDQEPLFSGQLDIDPDGRSFDSLVGKAHELTGMVLKAERLSGRALPLARQSVHKLLVAFPEGLLGAPLIQESLHLVA
jgi:hypothetical protein